MHPTKANTRSKGQSMAEFALALPILLLVLFGLLEVGRAVFMYSAVTNASREAVRYATAYGVNASDVLHYQNCAEIRDTAKRVAFLLPLSDDDITIGYDTGPELIDPDGTPDSGDESYGPPPVTPDIGVCDDVDGVEEAIVLTCGDRVVVTVTYNYSPIVPLVPQLTNQEFESSSARTYMGVIELSDDPEECK